MAILAPGELSKKFEQAVNQNDFETFRTDYKTYLSQFPAFSAAYSPVPTDLPVYSAIFGRTCFYLKQTNDIQAADILKDGRAASEVFGRLTIAERLDFLKVLQEKIKAHEQDIGMVISADTGKPVDLSVKEMTKGAEWFDYACQDAERQIGPRGPFESKPVAYPLGVAQIIGAYNYPYALAIGGIVGALTAGNGVVVSAPLKAPNWVFPFMTAVDEAVADFSAKAAAEGKPWAGSFAAIGKGLVQASVGVNRSLTAEADIVHFVGGDVTGAMIAKSRGTKPTILEMGGSNVVAVMASALDKPTAAKEIAETIYGGFGPATGQRCTAPRMLIAEPGAEDVVRELGKIITEGDPHIGNPFAKGTKMGPLVDRGAHQKMDEAMALAKELGATVYGTGKVNSNIVPQALDGNSFWVSPVMIDWSTANTSKPEDAERLKKLLGEEIFGPLLHVAPRIKGVDEAIAFTNKFDTHGLAGAIFSEDKAEIDKYADGVRTTSLTVNEGPKDRSPYGPHGHPGLRTIGGAAHFNLYTRERVVVMPKPKAAAPAPAKVA
ncbi:MAG: aldehyde dehydrogenase family protein [Alphaproteobacteria bacterium]|nr:MAG: aldehyde dehydrogenase family protein [Alphaproteobacteria bacterium]